MLGRILDRLAEWCIDHLDPKVARRLAAFMVVLSIVVFLYLPFSGEPPVIYAMSAMALLFSALLALVEAYRWTKEDPVADPDQPET